MEVTVDECVSGEEVLGLLGRFEPLHLPFSSSRWSMRVLGPVVQISALSVLDAGKELALRNAITPQLVGHDHPRHILQIPQQASEEAPRRFGVAAGLNEDVEDDTILINGAPEVVLHALNSDEDFIHMPLVAGLWSAASQAAGETRGEFLAPASHRLVGDDDAPLGKDQLDVPQAEAEHVVQPNSMADDLGREPVAVVGVGWRLHAASLARLQAACQTRLS